MKRIYSEVQLRQYWTLFSSTGTQIFPLGCVIPLLLEHTLSSFLRMGTTTLQHPEPEGTQGEPHPLLRELHD